MNVGDDAWMFGVRICPDLDTCMYTLGGGIDPERGWGHRNETWHAKEELAAYGVQPDWFGLGDRDLATHLVRSQMLRAGYPLSQVTEALCGDGRPVRDCYPPATIAVKPMSSSPIPRTARSVQSTSRSGGCATARRVPTHSFAFVGADTATAGPGRRRSPSRRADVVLLAPSNPVVSIGAILNVPGIRGALRSTTARVIGYSPIIAGKPLRGMADECLSVIGVASTSEAVGTHYGARSGTGILDGWLVHEGDHADIEGVEVRAVPLLMKDPATTAEMVRAGFGSGRAEGGSGAMTEHGSAAAVEMLPVPGLPEFRPGDDLAAAIAAAAPWLRDDDILVVTSKVMSKCEGRIVDAPIDHDERDALRRKLIDAEAVRVLARKGKTLITENAIGLVQAAAGVDGSNVDSAELALLPTDPDASAAALRDGLRERLGVTVGVVVTDTMGRAWRNGQTDVAIGAAGLTVLHGYEGSQDRHGNELIVTEIAVADEIAAAADLVKGKLTDIPVAVVRGLSLRTTAPMPPTWCAPARTICSGWAPRRR